jgi:predicted enzyme related to lactoylglutathione lyase
MPFRDPAVNYYVDDVDRAVAFYTTNFGFLETFRTPKTGTPDHVEIRLGNLVLGLASKEAAIKTHNLPLGQSTSPKAELVLWTDDVDHEYQTLTKKGVQELTPPHDFLGVLRSAWVMDPDGNPIQLVMKKATPPTP